MHLPQMHECNAKFLKLLFTEDFTVNQQNHEYLKYFGKV